MALFKNSDCNSIAVTKGKNSIKKLSSLLRKTQVICLLTETSFYMKWLYRKMLNIMLLIMFT